MKRLIFFSLVTLGFANASLAAGPAGTKGSPATPSANSGLGKMNAAPAFSQGVSATGLFHPAVFSQGAQPIHDGLAKPTSGYTGHNAMFGGGPSRGGDRFGASGYSPASLLWKQGSGQGSALSGASVQRLTESATFTGGSISVTEVVLTRASGSTIFGRYSFADGALSASGRFADVNGVWFFTVRLGASVAVFSINKSGQMTTASGTPFLACIDCGGTGNVGAFEGLGNLSTTSGNNNIGLFNGDFNAGTLSGDGNVGVLNGNFNGGTNNGNANIGLLNGNFNGVGYAPSSSNGGGNGNKNIGVFNGNFNGDSTVLATFH